MHKLSNTIYAFFISVVTGAIFAPIIIGLLILADNYRSVYYFASILAGLITYAYIRILANVLFEVFKNDNEDDKDKPVIVYHHNASGTNQSCPWSPWDKDKVWHRIKECGDPYIENLNYRFVKVLERTGIDQVHADDRHKLALMFSYLNSVVGEKHGMTDIDFFKAWTLGNIAILITVNPKGDPQQYAYNYDYETFVSSKDTDDTRFVIVVDEDGSLSYTAGLKEELINMYDLRRNLNW
jgi:hypothetical protein|nr:MAG TPA: contryphan [Caudoviricetes sp.]DAW78032.1 MAG TPA: contryphan [Caudoviricetes sp.]